MNPITFAWIMLAIFRPDAASTLVGILLVVLVIALVLAVLPYLAIAAGVALTIAMIIWAPGVALIFAIFIGGVIGLGVLQDRRTAKRRRRLAALVWRDGT